MTPDEQAAELAALTDDELEARKVAIEIEQGNRERRAQIPAKVRELAEQYEAVGGDPADLTAQITG